MDISRIKKILDTHSVPNYTKDGHISQIACLRFMKGLKSWKM
mgnify:CR=1 FL=1